MVELRVDCSATVFKILLICISDENKESFRHNYVSPILSGDISITDKAKFDLEILDKGIHITLLSDPFTPVPCPMMQMIISQ